MRQRWFPVALAALALAALAAVFSFFPRRPQAPPDAQVQAACSGCHLFPPPEILPRAAWRTQIEHMAFLQDYLPSGAGAPGPAFGVDDIVAWYESRAPEQFAAEPPITDGDPPPLQFERRSIRLGRESGPGVATVSRVGARIAAPNMSLGSVHLVSLAGGPRLVGNAGHPSRVAAGDLDGDGREDLVIGDLGDPMPTDEPTGRVLVALQGADGEFAPPRTLVEGIGRVADVRPADFDGDGDLDLLVAAFGFLREGGVYVLRNESQGGELEFRAERVSDRAGAVSAIPVEDLRPGSGRGFVVAFAQQHEIVSAFEPKPGGAAGYEERLLYRAPHPAWGTSHLDAADLDGDGDLDFVLANGDTLDDGVAFKPYHGVRWLENRGDGGFAPHPIGRLYGAHGVEAGDLDGDGDVDVVASGFLAQLELPVPAGAVRVDSLIWFERDGDAWIPRRIEVDHPRHTGVTLADFDGDGRLDIVAAVNRAWDATAVETGPSLELWLNQGGRP